jgi:hypothetical protein
MFPVLNTNFRIQNIPAFLLYCQNLDFNFFIDLRRRNKIT